MSDGLEFTAEELTQASAERLATMDNDSEAKTEQPEASQVSDEAAQDQDTETTTSTLTETDTSVLEAFPEDMREHVVDLPADVVAELSKGYLRQNDYTRKSQDNAKSKKSDDLEAGDAASWRELMQNEAARDAVIGAIKEQREGSAPADFDWTVASSEEISEEIDRRASVVGQKLLREKVDVPRERVAGIKAAAIEYRNELGESVSDGAFGRAWQDMIGRYGADAVTSDNARHLLAPFVDIQALKTQLDGGKTSMSERVGKAATTPGRVGVSPKAKPKWVAEGRDPDEGERMDATLFRLKEMTGARWSESDLDDLLAQG